MNKLVSISLGFLIWICLFMIFICWIYKCSNPRQNRQCLPGSTYKVAGSVKQIPLSLKYTGSKKPQYFLKPQILDELYFITKTVVMLLNNANIDYWIDYGSLLGALRHKGFIPWDDDFDICIPTREVEKFKALGPLLSEKGYDIVPYLFGYKVVPRNMGMYPFVDIFVMTEKDGMFVQPERQKTIKNYLFGCEISSPKVSDVFPLQYIPFEDFYVKAPAKSKEVIDSVFGENAMTSAPGFSYFDLGNYHRVGMYLAKGLKLMNNK